MKLRMFAAVVAALFLPLALELDRAAGGRRTAPHRAATSASAGATPGHAAGAAAECQPGLGLRSAGCGL